MHQMTDFEKLLSLLIAGTIAFFTIAAIAQMLQ